MMIWATESSHKCGDFDFGKSNFDYMFDCDTESNYLKIMYIICQGHRVGGHWARRSNLKVWNLAGVRNLII